MIAFLIAAGANAIRPLYLRGESPVARLARLAGQTSQPGDGQYRELLIVYSGLYRPAPLFYSDRPVVVAYTRDNLAGFTEDRQAKKIILASKDADALQADYEIEVIAQAEPYVYGTIRLRGDK
jgi:hypothetical protein